MPNFSNIRLYPLNLRKNYKRKMVEPQNFHISCMTLLNWFNFIFYFDFVHKILVWPLLVIAIKYIFLILIHHAEKEN